MNYFGKLIWIRLKFVKKFSFCFCRLDAVGFRQNYETAKINCPFLTISLPLN